MTAAGTTERHESVYAGVDSHKDTIHVAVVTDHGGHISDAEFPTTRSGRAPWGTRPVRRSW